MISLPKNVIVAILAVTTALVVFYVIGYFLAKSSDPFSYTKHELAMSNYIKETVGEPVDFNLDFFGYAIKHEGPKARAEFSLTAIGTKSSAKIRVKLETDLGVWHLTGLRVNDESIAINGAK